MATLTAASCGGGSDRASANASDGGVDASSSKDGAPARPGVTVTILAEGKPVRLARVIFHDETGRILEDTETDDSGRAARSPAPSMVTVQDPTDSHLITFLGVIDGDELAVTGEEPFSSGPVYIGSYYVEIPGPFAGADGFKSWVGYCDPGYSKDATQAVFVLAGDDCARTGEAVLLAAVPAVDAADKPMAFAAKGGLTPTRSSVDALSVTTDGWHAAASTTLEGRVGSLAAGQSLYGDLSARIGREHFVLATLPAGPATPAPPLPVQIPVGVTDGFEVFFQVFADATRKSYSQVIAYQASGPFVIDANDALPLITAASVAPASPGQFDVAWTLAAPATTADGTIAFVDMNPGVSIRGAGWAFVVPPGLTSLRTPMLPQDILDRAGVPSGVEIYVLDADDVDGFQAFKQVPNLWTGRAAFNPPYPPRAGMRTRFVSHL